MKSLLLTLARHGETDWNADGRIQGQRDIPLNAKGRQQAAALTDALAARGIDAIYSSDLERARQTAEPLAALLGLPLLCLPEWRERHHGRMQGSTYEELALSWPEGHRRLRARDPDFDVDGGESLVALSQRAARGLQGIRERHVFGQVVVVTHGGMLDVVHRLVTGQPLQEPRRFAIRNCAYHRLQHDGRAWSILNWGEEAHLANARDELPD
jgi:probable phosphoglycerate mutase